MKRRGYIKLGGIAGSVVLVDQVVKWIIAGTVPLYQSIPLIPGFFNLTHIQNTGGAFGFLARQGTGLRILIFIVLSSLAAGLILYLYRKTVDTHPFLSSGFALIFGGAIGNLIDRVRFGRVTDFLDVYIGDLHWPVFNVADSAVTVGTAIFLYHFLFNKIPE